MKNQISKGISLGTSVAGKLAKIQKLPAQQSVKSAKNVIPRGMHSQFSLSAPQDPGGDPNHFTYRDLRLLTHDNPLNSIKKAASGNGGVTPNQNSSTGGGYGGF